MSIHTVKFDDLDWSDGSQYEAGHVELPAGTLADIAVGPVYAPSVARPDGAEFLRFHLAGE